MTTNISPQELLRKLVGKWEGNCKTWFEPGKLSDESEVTGEFSDVFGGRFVRHCYQGTMQGKPRQGEELIAFNAVVGQFETTWVDDFHMNYAILFSHGKPTSNGFHVLGEYDIASGKPKWGWRTEFALLDDNNLTITAFNIQPDGEESKGVETIYRRT